MFFRQYELGCLSLYSYMIGDTTTGRAVVIDPQRDIGIYLEEAAASGLKIERVIETHFHADFVSGHLELARATGAVISYGPGAETEFPIEPLADGQRLLLGDVVLEVRATPGHTPESISLVVWENGGAGDPWAVLTGDTLFIGDVGRPDLLASAGISPEALARQLYRSLHEKLLTLPEATRVFPAHGAGSSCGRAMSSDPSSTIGEQRRTNYALAPIDEEAFVAAVAGDQPTVPAYFAFAASTNRRHHVLHDDSELPPSLSIEEVSEHQRLGAVVVDARSPQAFSSGHLEGSVNVDLDGRFAEYAGALVEPGRPVVVVTDAGREAEARTRLARVGCDNVVGHLPAIEVVLADHPGMSSRARRLPNADLAEWMSADPDLQVLDVRNSSELQGGMIPGSKAVPLAVLRDRLGELDPGRDVVVVCASGSRSSMAASLLRSEGFATVADLLGGFDAWASAGLPVAGPRV